ncbi:thioesterase [Streptomyces sp. CB03234]|uniref:thioesterase II family protein n=1 Tax=Streptomyces sp. (strain CB03234) TaxID=1703937 RepID=UPI00093CFD7A|nr:alpha/beta fold hydrolase [Streptomyces sp. CB03234]OKK04801.1 thioesterase [Streptomyces sp. CB03234]
MSGSLSRPLPRPRAAMTLVCLSFCGGGTAPFRPWARVLPEDVELALYCYPGREGRFTVPYAADWEALMADALDAVGTLPARPFVLLGHSMGAWVAADLARRLEEGTGPEPAGLVVSAADAPTRLERRHDTVPHLGNTDEEIVAWMAGVGQVSPEVLAEPELRDMAVEVLRADLCVVDSYRHRPGMSVGAPLRVLYGERDGVGAEAAERWRPLARGAFEVERLPGGHFYTPEVWASLPERIPALYGVGSAR